MVIRKGPNPIDCGPCRAEGVGGMGGTLTFGEPGVVEKQRRWQREAMAVAREIARRDAADAVRRVA